jgi:cellulose synthase/poly-beta-1,6-N-acetylglucosamine synthase-like glycosyltransferase
MQQLEWTLKSLINCGFNVNVNVINNDPSPIAQARVDRLLRDMPPIYTAFQPGSNKKWMGAINIGLEETETEFFCMMNDDVLFPPNSTDFWPRLLGHFHRDTVGAVGPSSNFVAGTQNAFNVDLPILLESSLLIGFCMVVRTELLRELGGLDESLPGGDDLDSSIRIRQAGYRLVVDRGAYLHHIGQQTGTRVHGEHWDSQDHQEATNNAIIKKHGVAAWQECFSMNWNEYRHREEVAA